MSLVRRELLIGASMLMLAGCGMVTSKQEVEQEVDEAVQEEALDVGEQWSVSARSGEVQAGWIELFNDPVLTALVIEAQENNRSLTAAAANVDRAWALARRAGAALKPDATVTGRGTSVGSVGSSATSETLLVAGTVSWEIDVWGRIRAGQRAAESGALAVEADLRSAQQSLAAATARAYFTAIDANVLTGISMETVEILVETLRIVNVRYKNGMASAQDLSLARSDLATAREQLAAIEGSQRDAVRALEAILGRYPGAELEVRETLPEAPLPPPAGLPSELLERRPDIVAAERRVASAFNATAQARAARLPAISLTGLVGSASNSLSDLAEPGNAVWAGGAGLLAPIYDGGVRRANVDVATAEQKQALAQYGQTAINAFGEVETNLDQGVVIAQRITELEESVSEAENAFRIAKRRYEEGEEDLLTVLTIQRRVNTATSSLSRLERQLLEQRVNLNLALGGGWES